MKSKIAMDILEVIHYEAPDSGLTRKELTNCLLARASSNATEAQI
jgi:hypothetical protein